MGTTNIPRESDVVPTPDPTGGRSAGWTPADPGPLGLAAFATTTFVLSIVNANLVSGATLPMVAGLALAYGGIAQLFAGMWEFRTGNTFGAVAFSSYGAFWISFFVIVQIGLPGIPAKEIPAALGLYLWAWGIFTCYMFIASLRTTGAVALVFILLAITYIVLGIGNSGSDSGIVHLGGYLGIATAIAAWYASFAAVTNATWGRTVMPVFPLRGR
ncbi:MAG: acetate uptake transporter [Solirubrobacteraceae bacterium]